MATDGKVRTGTPGKFFPVQPFLTCTGDIPNASPSITELEWVRAISDFNSRGVIPVMWVRGFAGTYYSARLSRRRTRTECRVRRVEAVYPVVAVQQY